MTGVGSRSLGRWGLGVAVGTVLAVTVGLASEFGASPRAAPASPVPAVADVSAHPLTAAVAAGVAQRLAGPHGPIHTWRPAGYPLGGPVVIYVHGYYDDVDQAWRNHQLPAQFANSGLGALFIAPEAPQGLREAVHYPDLGELVRWTTDALGLPPSHGPWIALGHSGAFRTLTRWTAEPMLDGLVLLDALYGELEELAAWPGPGARGRMIVVADDTVRWGEDWARAHPGVVEIDRLPVDLDDVPAEAFTAQRVYLRAEVGHMDVITGGRALPITLRLFDLPLLADAPWAHPWGALPPAPTATMAPRGAR